jgi:hypothetical protein
MSLPERGGGIESAHVPQRPIPPVNHVWVAAPGDGRRLYRSTVARTPALQLLGIVWAVCLALLVVGVATDPAQNITWLVVAVIFPTVFISLLIRRGKAQEALMAPGFVWASGFGANELLIVTPVSTLLVDYAALVPPRIVGPAVLIRTRYATTATSLPLQLFPPEALAFLRQRTALG